MNILNRFKVNQEVRGEIDHVLNKLKVLSPESKEYTTAVSNLKVLYEAQAKRPASLVEPETVLIVLANLAGIIGILYFERFDVISSKAFGHIMKPRI